MLEIKENGAIYLTRGDSAYLEVNIKHKGKDYVAQDGDILTFSVKKYVDDEDYIIHKTFKAENAIVINPEDTKLCAFGKYIYDVQMTTPRGEVFTVVEPTLFYIKEEVTHD